MPVVTITTDGTEPPQWLTHVLAAARRERPLSRAYGRCLGDFLDKEMPLGLPYAERMLLVSVREGTGCRVSERVWNKKDDLEKLQSDPDLRVRAWFLRFLMLGGDDLVAVHEAGVEIYGAFIEGVVDLRFASCVGRLALINCYIDGPLWVEGASLSTLYLRRCRVAGIQGNRAKIAGSVFLESGFVSNGPVSFYGAEIGGSLQCTGGRIENGTEETLTCSVAKIRGRVALDRGFESKGCVFLNGAHIDADLDCSGGIFENPTGRAIQAAQANIAGSVFFQSLDDHLFQAIGSVWLAGAEIGGSLSCSGGCFRGPESITSDGSKTYGTALDGSRAKIKSAAHLNRCASGANFRSNGCVVLRSAHMDADLDCSGGIFENTGGAAIEATDVHVGSNVFLSEYDEKSRFLATGSVSLVNAEIGGWLNCSGGSFKQPAGTALNCSNAILRSGASLSQIVSDQGEFGGRFEAEGSVSFIGANIEGPLWCAGGSFKRPEHVDEGGKERPGRALDCSSARIKGQVSLGYTTNKRGQLGQRFEAQGEVCFWTTQVDAHLDCAGGRFSNPTGGALSCQAAKIGGCVFLSQSYSDEASSSSNPSAFRSRLMVLLHSSVLRSGFSSTVRVVSSRIANPIRSTRGLLTSHWISARRRSRIRWFWVSKSNPRS